MAPAEAVIAHRSPGRLRLRVAGHHGDRRFFEEFAVHLGRCPGIRDVQVNPYTGSVLIQHDAEAEAVVNFGGAHDLFVLAKPETRAHVRPSDAARLAFQTFDIRLRQRTAETWNVRELAFFVLSIGGVVQMARQHFWPAGFTLFWYATTLLEPRERRK